LDDWKVRAGIKWSVLRRGECEVVERGGGGPTAQAGSPPKFCAKTTLAAARIGNSDVLMVLN
jgi:hypothetical protein